MEIFIKNINIPFMFKNKFLTAESHHSISKNIFDKIFVFITPDIFLCSIYLRALRTLRNWNSFKCFPQRLQKLITSFRVFWWFIKFDLKLTLNYLQMILKLSLGTRLRNFHIYNQKSDIIQRLKTNFISFRVEPIYFFQVVIKKVDFYFFRW